MEWLQTQLMKTTSWVKSQPWKLKIILIQEFEHMCYTHVLGDDQTYKPFNIPQPWVRFDIK